MLLEAGWNADNVVIDLGEGLVFILEAEEEGKRNVAASIEPTKVDV